MAVEHRLIRHAVRALGDALATGGSARLGELHGALAELLARHNMKEERVLYPACDNALTPSERAALAHRLAH
jgi:hypothetical protein